MKQTKEIAEILRKRDPEKYKAIIERDELNGYHDFKFDMVPGHPEYGDTLCPKIQLVYDLAVFPELNDIREEVLRGVYDERPDEEDRNRLEKELRDEGMSQEFIDNIIGKR